MAFDDRQLDDHPWTWGSTALLVAGFTHLGTIVLQVLLVGGIGTWMAVSDAHMDPTTIFVIVAWYLAPIAGTLLVAGLMFMGARRLRFCGPGPLVWLALASGVFWPMMRMGLALVACGVFEVPLHLLGALASLAAALVVAMDPATKQLKL